MPRDGRATKERILASAESLVIDQGFAATSVDQVIAASGTSKGAFFHHFDSKQALARDLVSRYAAADVGQLEAAIAHAEEVSPDPATRLDAFLGYFVDRADEIMSEQSSCLYIAVLTEQQLVQDETLAPIRQAVLAWRSRLSGLILDASKRRSAAASLDPTIDPAIDPATAPAIDAEALADHVFVTFEGAFILARTTGDPAHMRSQLQVLRQLVAAAVG